MIILINQVEIYIYNETRTQVVKYQNGNQYKTEQKVLLYGVHL